MHTRARRRPERPAFAPEEPSVESLGLLTATVDEEIERVFLSLPEDDERSRRSSAAARRCASSCALLTHAGSSGRVIRTHGDYHLGQTLWAGTTGSSSTSRASPRGRWWSAAVSARRCATSPGCSARSPTRRRPPSSRATPTCPRTGRSARASAFLEGYLETVDATLLPPGEAAIERLLAVFELEKAVYELRYELDNRPDWVRIPVAGIERLMHQAAEAL